MVSGGTGALGSLAADWLARRGAAHLRLLGRAGRCEPRNLSLCNLLSRETVACVTLTRCSFAVCLQVQGAWLLTLTGDHK